MMIIVAVRPEANWPLAVEPNTPVFGTPVESSARTMRLSGTWSPLLNSARKV